MSEFDQDTALRVGETALIIDLSLKRLLTDVNEKLRLDFRAKVLFRADWIM